jgi:type I restriction enzyme R subunit
VLFLVDRTNLGEQAEKEFQAYRAPGVNRKFTELYNVQRLASNSIMDSSRVVIATIQRVYSMLKGEPDLDPAAELASQFETGGAGMSEPLPVVYNAAFPPEYFDVVEIHPNSRSREHPNSRTPALDGVAWCDTLPIRPLAGSEPWRSCGGTT